MEQPDERLIIDNFAGIKQLDLEVRPFTVLIGPQSVGKSVTAKLLYFFRSIRRFLLEAAVNEQPPAPEWIISEKFNEFFPLSTHTDNTFTLIYQQAHTTVRLEHITTGISEWHVQLPEKIDDAFATYCKHRLSSYGGSSSSDKGSLILDEGLAEYSVALAEIFSTQTTFSHFIPAGRSFYPQVETDMASFFRNASLDPFVTEFGIYLARLRRRFSARSPQTRDAGQAARALSKQLLSGEYARVGNKDFIVAEGGRSLPPALWSSGQQEAQPLTLVLQHHCEWPDSTSPLFIEEPEAHLFPASQRTMTEFISLAFNANLSLSWMFLTTHSPYILTTINNLLLAGQIYAADPSLETRNRLDSLIPTNRALSPGSVGAFYMDQDGCRPIMDEETGLIDANAIDGVSDKLNETFEALLDLQYHP